MLLRALILARSLLDAAVARCPDESPSHRVNGPS
jgi:hypothetical protein